MLDDIRLDDNKIRLSLRQYAKLPYFQTYLVCDGHRQSDIYINL